MSRTRRNDNRSTYRVETEKGVYLVTLERLKNDTCGNPRYNANIIEPESLYTVNYSFGGHYCGDRGEAEYIVKRYEADCLN